MTSRTSLESAAEQEKHLEATRSLQDAFEKAGLKLKEKASEFKDGEEPMLKDPAIVSSDVTAQLAFLRKLKFQYLEQNAKDKYVKTIVSDIDDAPMVTADDNRELAAKNEQKKAKLRDAKAKLADVQNNIKTLAPLVEEDYDKAKKAIEKATMLSQKIIDAKLALNRLRQTHPHPRLTIPMADQKLAEQVEQMQTLHDDVQETSKKAQTIKDKVKEGTVEVEKLRMQRAELDKSVKAIKKEDNGDDDRKLKPLYDWLMASLEIHRLLHGLQKSHVASENELRLTYNVAPSPADDTTLMTICLVFAPDTRHLAAVQVIGLEELDLDVGGLIDTHIQTNDVHGLVAAVLSHVRVSLALRTV